MDPMVEEEGAYLEQRGDEGGGAEGTTNLQDVRLPLVASRCIEELVRGGEGSPPNTEGEGEAEGKARELELLLGWHDGQDHDQLVPGAGGSTLQSGPSQSLLAQERDGWASFPPQGHTECSSKRTAVAIGNGKVACAPLYVEHEEACNEEESSDVFQRTPTTAESALRTARLVYHSASMKSTSSDEFGDFDWQGPSVASQAAPTVGIPLPEQWQLLCREVFPSSSNSCEEEGRAAGQGADCVCTPNPLSRLAESSSLWREAVSDALIPRPELWSHPVIDGGFGSAVRMVCSQRQGQLKVAEQDGTEDRVSISSCEDFDWSLEDASPFLLNLRELSLGNVSPEAATMVAYLRSNVVSPVEVEMDIEQATAGLSLLSEDELEAMIEEMQAKFSRLSESLIDGLQEREGLVQEREVRHKFIAAVQKLVQHRENLSFGPGGGTNLTVKELKRLASKKRSKEKSPIKYLHTVIPYTARPTQVPWNLDTLEKLTRILGAIQSNLDVIPALMREYLTECLELDLDGSDS